MLAFAAPAVREPKSIILDNPSDLHSISNGADYIIISHSDFITSVLPLASFRESQGFRVKVVDIQQVFDEFSAGIVYPLAILSIPFLC